MGETKRMEGSIDAFSKERKRVKINGEWYDVQDAVVPYLKKGYGKIRIEDGKVAFIEYTAEAPTKMSNHARLILYESLIRTASRITAAKTTSKRLQETLTIADKIYDFLKEKGLVD